MRVVTSISALTEEYFGSSLASTMLPDTPVNRPLTFDSIMCRTLNSARLWRGSMCHTDQFWTVGAVLDSVTVDTGWRPFLNLAAPGARRFG